MYYSVFASVQDVINQAQKEPDWDAIKKSLFDKEYCFVDSMRNKWHEVIYGDEFFGGGLEKATKKFEGDHSYEARITANIESQFESENFFKKRFKFHNRQIQGQRVDIPRYLNNDPRFWFSVKKIPMPNRAVRVFAPMGGLAGVSSREMQVCGALTCAICEALEANGISVELWASCCCKGVFRKLICTNQEQMQQSIKDPNWQDICHLVKIKDSSQYCDYGMINYVTGDSGFYRQFIFLDRIISGIKRINSGIIFSDIGGSYNFRKELIPPDEDYNSENDIVVPRIYDIDQAKMWLEQNLNNTIGNINSSAEEEENEQEE